MFDKGNNKKINNKKKKDKIIFKSTTKLYMRQFGKGDEQIIKRRIQIAKLTCMSIFGLTSNKEMQIKATII